MDIRYGTKANITKEKDRSRDILTKIHGSFIKVFLRIYLLMIYRKVS